jgi:signal peptidase I
MKNWEIGQPIETRYIPAEIKNKGFQKCFIYRGNSMLPTFRPGELIYSRPIDEGCRPGDVVVFKRFSDKTHTVHRIVSISGSRFITRGDNNSRIDPNPVKSSELIGRVEMVEVANQLKPVRGGKSSLRKARIRWGKEAFKKRIPLFLRNRYGKIRQSRMFVMILHKFLGKHMKTIRIQIPEGTLIKTTYKDRTVAYWIEGTEVFYCRKPFDLIIKKKLGEK